MHRTRHPPVGAAQASGCGYEIMHEQIPLTRGSTVDQALSDGEDFELLFAMAPRHASMLESAWKRSFPRLPLTRIGKLLARSKSSKSKLPRGHDHFAQR